jgi:uncharacterized membrane protein
MSEDDTHGLTGRLRANIGSIEERRQREAAEARLPTRIAHGIGSFAGSLTFLLIHALIVSLWVLSNFGLLPGISRFDPLFDRLGDIASVEAIFLSTFVLISQRQLGKADERRADLDLHINLLAEHELTRLASLTERIAAKLGVTIDDPDFAEVKRDVEPAQVLDGLDAVRHET